MSLASSQPFRGPTPTGSRRLRDTAFAFAVAAAGLFVCSQAMAQTASQVTQPSYAPQLAPRVGGGIDLPATTGLVAPAGAEALTVTPSAVVVEGALPGMEAATAAVNERLAGKRVSAAELFEAAGELETAYARAGYLLVRVSLPPQTITDGAPVRMAVTDGYVERVDVSALPERVRGRVAATLAPLVGKRGVQKGELERRLLLASDIPGVTLRSTLKAGDQPGGTIVVIDGRYDPVSGSVSANNSLSDQLGPVTIGLNAQLNSVFGLGETIYGSLNGYPGFGGDNIFSADPRNRQIAIGAILPLGTDGVWLNVEGVDSQTNPDNNFGFRIRDKFQRLSTRLGYDWWRARDLNLTAVAAFDVANETETFIAPGVDVPIAEDRLRVIRLMQQGSLFVGEAGQFTGSVTLSIGLDAFGARSPTPTLPMTRFGAEPNFQKLALSASYAQALAGGRVQLSALARAQTSFGAALPASEQISFGGVGSLSAYDLGTVTGDSGAFGRLELAVPIVLPSLPDMVWLGSTISPYGFAAAGIVELSDPTALEDASEQATSFGLGLRLGLSQRATPRNGFVEVEYAHGTDTVVGDDDRFNLRLQANF